MKAYKRILSLILVGVISMNAAGCKKKTKIEEISVTDKIGDYQDNEAKRILYSHDRKDLSVNMKNISEVMAYNDSNNYILTDGTAFFTCNSDYDDIKEIGLANVEFGNSYKYTVTNDGTICILVSEPKDSESDAEKLVLYKYSVDGKLISATETEGLMKRVIREKYNIASLYCSADGEYFCAEIDGKSYTFTADGKKVIEMMYQIDTSDVPVICYGKDINGNPVAVVQGETENSFKICKIDLKAGEISDISREYEVDNVVKAVFTGNGEYSYYIRTVTSVYGIKQEDSTIEKLFEINNTQISGYAIKNVKAYDKETFDVLATENSKVPQLITLKRLSDEQIANIPHLKVYINNYFVKSKITEKIYNKLTELSNDTSHYDLEIVKYAYSGNTEVPNTDEADIILGSGINNIVDYLDTNPSQQLVDLSEFIDNDPDLSRDSFVPGLLEKIEAYHGGLYALPLSFSFNTKFGLTSEVGEKENWTFPEYLDTLQKSGGNYYGKDSGYTRYKIDELFSFDIYEFIDFEKNECFYNSDEFKQILEYCNQYDVRSDDRNVYINGSDFYSYTDSSPDVMINTISVYSYHWLLQSLLIPKYHNSDITFVGYPSFNGSGTRLNFDDYVGISKKCENKEAAWELLKKCITEEPVIQSLVHYGGSLPMLQKEYQKELDNISNKYIYSLDSDGLLVELQREISEVNTNVETNEELVYTDLTDEEIEEMFSEEKVAYSNEAVEKAKEIITHLMDISTYQPTKYIENDYIFTTVCEEAEKYFYGEETVDVCAENIQKKIDEYLNPKY